nr:GDP-mannose 4,6-dehydratase [Candidatus Sigynarchaeum springense]
MIRTESTPVSTFQPCEPVDDVNQKRSCCYMEDCLEGILRLMASDHREPLNIGSDRIVSINDLIDNIISISKMRIKKRYNPDAPQGIRGRFSDNTKLRQVLGWEPHTKLQDGLRKTYE